jgi:hypothetical protein
MNLTRGTGSKLAAATLVVCMQSLLLPASSAAAPASLTGTVVSVDPTREMSGVIVRAADPATGRIYSSNATDAGGDFILEDLPPGSYEIAVESAGVLYLVGSAVKLEAGQSRALHLKLDASEGAGRTVPASEIQGVWNNPLTATLIVVGAVIAIGLIADSTSDDDEPPSSPY